MSSTTETTPSVHEQAVRAPIPDTWQPSGQFAANPEQTEAVINATDSVSEQKIDSTILPEMPNSHPEVDIARVSVNGLIKNCPHYAEMYKRNPEHAKAEATHTTEKLHEFTDMLEQGMSAKEIKAKMLADNLARAKERAQSAAKEELKPEPATTHKPKHSEEHTPASPKRCETDTDMATAMRQEAERVTAGPSIVAKTEVAIPIEQPAKQIEREQPAKHVRVETGARLAIEQDTAVIRTERAAEKAEHTTQQPHFLRAYEAAIQAKQQQVAAKGIELPAAPPLGKSEHPPSCTRGTEVVEVAHAAMVDAILYDDAPAELPLINSHTDDSGTILEYDKTPDVIIEPSHESTEELQDFVVLVSADSVTKTAEQSVTEVRPEQVTCVDKPDRGPEELYEDFTEALRRFAESMAMPMEPGNDSPDQAKTTDEYDIASPTDTLDVVEPQPLPPIVHAVTEILIELEPDKKETVVPMVQDIVAVMAKLQRLTIDKAPLESVATAKAYCEKLIIVLFETLDIKYEEEDIKAFMSVIMHSDFQPPIQTEKVIEADLEHDGTREAKRNFTTRYIILAARARLQQLLGAFVLFHAHLGYGISG